MLASTYATVQMERDHGSLQAGFSWPPPPPQRSPYTCGFCKREFSSSQALGGHMNVHRWDRAMLIQCSSLHHLPSLPNPNPSHGVDLAPSLNLSPPHRASHDGDSTGADKPPVLYSFFSTSSSAMTKRDLEANMEFGVGSCSNGGGMEDGLDLELRLGGY